MQILEKVWPKEARRRLEVARVRSSIYCLRWIWKDWRQFCGFLIVWKLCFPVSNWFLFACACLWYENTSYHEGIEILCTVRRRLHERGFIWNRIVFDAATPSVYTTPIETIAETGSNLKRCPKWSVFKTIRFHLSCKRRNYGYHYGAKSAAFFDSKWWILHEV